MLTNMAPRHTKHAFPLKFAYLFHSRNTLFNLFIFLIGLSIGFVCAFYLQDISVTVQSSIFSIFNSLLLLPPPSSNTSISSISPSQASSPVADGVSSLTLQTQVMPAAPIASPPSSPSPPPLSLPHGDVISPSSPSPDSRLSSLTLQTQELSSAPIASPPSQPSSLPPPPPLSLPDGDTLSPSSTLPPLPPPLPSPPADTLTFLPQVILPAPIASPPVPLSLPDGDNISPSPPADTLTLSSQVRLPAPTASPPAPLSLQDGGTLSPSSTSPPLLSPAKGVSLNERIPRMHNMSDQDLVASVMKISTMSVPNNAPSKVAFMFLTPGPLPLLPLWELFFKGHESLFSIYIHPHPSYNDTIPQDSVFYGTRITSQPVYWGDISMVDAERRILANALLDPLNQRFVLLSESCIPLFNFTTIYNYLINSNLSYVNSFDDKRKTGRGRYNPQMSPNITIQDWRKGSQWFEVGRDLALGIAGEQKYYSLFKEYCHPPCYNDEHYLPTLVNILYGRLNSNRSVMYVDWSIAGPHPRRFVHNDITEEFLNSIRYGSAECVYNDNTTPMCVLFARKFTPSTLKPLLTFAPLLFGSSS